MIGNDKRLVIVLLVFFLTDRVFKHLALFASPADTGDFFYFAPLINKAGPFSLPLPSMLLFIAGTLALFWLNHLAILYFFKKELIIFMGVGLMLIGGFSNFLDRVVLGGVIDVWQVALPVGFSFNLSDVYLLVGMAIIIFFYKKQLTKKLART